MSGKAAPTWLVLASVIAVALACIYIMTHGFRAITSEQARKIELATTRPEVPSVLLVDSHRRVHDLRAIVSEKSYTVVALVYTQCTTLCLLTTSGEAFLQAKLEATGLDRDVGLLTISFDPTRDTPEALARYAHRVKARPGLWTIATVARPADLSRVLRAFDIVVIPDGEGGFTHNGALFLIDDKGQIFEALEPDAADEALTKLIELLGVKNA